MWLQYTTKPKVRVTRVTTKKSSITAVCKHVYKASHIIEIHKKLMHKVVYYITNCKVYSFGFLQSASESPWIDQWQAQ